MIQERDVVTVKYSMKSYVLSNGTIISDLDLLLRSFHLLQTCLNVMSPTTVQCCWCVICLR